MRIVVATLIGDFGDFQIGRSKKFLGMANSKVVQIISEGFSNLLMENGAEIPRTKIEFCCNLVHF